MSTRPQAERRRNRRSPQLKHLRVTWDGAPSGEHRISDLSADGLFVQTAEPLAVDTPIKLILEAPGKEIRTCGMVRHSIAGKGMGVEFVEMSEYDRERLKNLVEAVEALEAKKARRTVKAKSGDHASTITSAPELGLAVKEETGARAEAAESQSAETIDTQVRDLSSGECAPDAASTKSDETANPDQEDAAPREAPAIAAETSKTTQRQLPRIDAQIPVRAFWEDGEEHLAAEGTTVNVSAGGALLSVSRCAAVGQRMTVINSNTGEQIECHVRSVKQDDSGRGQARIEFLIESRNFWGSGILGDEPRQREPEQKPSPAPSPKPIETRVAPKPPIQQGTKRIPGDRRPAPSQTIPVLLSQHWRAAAGAGFALLCALVWLIWGPPTRHGSEASTAPSQAAENLAGVPPDDARLIPDGAKYALATEMDFDPRAASWVRSQGLPVSGDVPGEFVGPNESHAYILKGENLDWRVVIVANGRIHCDIHYSSIAIAARVPKSTLGRTLWSPKSVLNTIAWQSESGLARVGDGLLVVRSGGDATSGVVLVLTGDEVTAAIPSSYVQVHLR